MTSSSKRRSGRKPAHIGRHSSTSRRVSVGGHSRLNRLVRVGAVLAMAVAGLAIVPIASVPAQAAAGDGTVQVRVVQDAGANGYVVLNTSGADEGQQTPTSQQVNPPLSGVEVTLTDADGHTMTATTGADGLATFDPSNSDLTGGQYRVDVTNPKPGTFSPGFAANGQTVPAGQVFTAANGSQPATVAPVAADDLANPNNEKFSSDTEFVDVSGGTNAYVNTSFWFPAYYCQNNAAVCDASQPWDAPPGGVSADTEKTLFSATYELDQPDEKLATKADTGAVYGIAYDRAHKRIFSAAYAKRGSAYGPGGPGGIYVTDLTSTSYPLAGTTSLWKTVPDAGSDTHDMATNQDYAFFDQVGKTSLGDIDTTTDGKYLFGVNMNNKTAFVYDLDNDTYQGSYPIPNPGCGADWRPMGSGSGIDGNWVGGVCSGQSDQDMSELSAHVYSFDPASGTFGTQVLSQPLTYERGIVRTDAGICTGAYQGADYTRWYSWVDAFPADGGEETSLGCDGAHGTGVTGRIAYPTPMLDDIVEETNGDLVIAFRDRFTDQTGYNSFNQNADGTFVQGDDPTVGGDIVRGCKLANGSYVLDTNYNPATDTLALGSVCTNNNSDAATNGGQPTTFREYYTGDWRVGGIHKESFYGGIALSRSEPTVISSSFDGTDAVYTQSISAVGRGGTLPTGLTKGLYTGDGTVGAFGKGAGMADLEVLCDEAPIQIGNRVWTDSNDNGIQDAGEAPIAGVTVNLYDSDGNLVGTTTTNDNGDYYFDNTNVDGGLDQNTDYTVKIDNPDDYAADGPLDGLAPTKANAGSDDEHDSDGVVPDGGTYPQVSLTTGGAGEDNHTYDFGFVQHTPAVDIEKYDTVGGATDGDADTAATAVAYKPGESRTIGFDVTNTGTDALRNVAVTDDTITGGTVTDMSCTFPGHDNPTAGALADGTWTVTWTQTQGATPSETWAAGVTFPCTATLTLAGDAPPHADNATVTGTSVATGATVDDSDAYNAYTGDVQLVKYDSRDGFTPTQDADGIPQKPLVDGAARDANTADSAVTYVVPPGGSDTGRQPVSWAVTNTGTTWLGNIAITDDTLDGPDLQDISCDFSTVGGPASGTTWDGPWAPGSTFYCTGALTLSASGANSAHGDKATVTSTVIAPEPNPDYTPGQPGNPFTDQPELDNNGNPVLSDVNPTDDDTYYGTTTVPTVTLNKGDGDASSDTISHDANTMGDGQAYTPGETRDIVVNLTNSGTTPLYDVTVTDALTAGNTTITGLSCVFPGQASPTAGTLDGTTWTVYWTKTFEGADPAAWAPGDSFSCTATLTMDGPADPHADTATVTTNLSPAGVPGDADNPPPATPNGPTDQDAYNAYTGDIQVIKYDGNKADPDVGAGPNAWTPPAKPLTDPDQDANTAAAAVDYPTGKAQPVRWVVTNTGGTWMTDVALGDTTNSGPDIGAWTCDLSPVGGPANYSFTSAGPWAGPLAPGASFFCQGPLTLPANSQHSDTVKVTGTVVQPKFDDNDQPILDDNGVPEYATDNDGNPVASDVKVSDDDEFNADTPTVKIVKGDGHGSTIVNDADSTDTGAAYKPTGETRTIVSVATNPSASPLHNVALTDVTTAGTAPTDMSCTFPDGSSAQGSYDASSKTWTIRWAATFAPGTITWAPGDEITCHSKLTLNGSSEPHRDVANVAAVTPGGTDVTDSNPYNAFSGDIQVIKYDGNTADPTVGTSGAWTPPAKPLSEAGQDANDAKNAVGYQLDSDGTSTGPQKVRWVVTNTGKTWLTNVVIADVTELGPSLNVSTVSCTFPDGTAAGVVKGKITWHDSKGVLFEPGASFFCQGMLTLAPDADHADHVTATAAIVPPAADKNGNPTDRPLLGPDGLPRTAINPDTGKPWTVGDSDSFHATSPAAAASPSSLAFTGADVAAILSGAGVLLVGGLLLLLFARRRRSA